MSHTKGNVMLEDSGNLNAMNEKVQALANGVYKELEFVIGRYGGNAVKGLMPIVVNILECLDQNIKDKQKHEVDLELTKVEIEHLKNQCEKEKSLRKSTDLKYLETEDMLEETKKHLNQLKNASESNARRLEMKLKNMQDHISRLEEKETKFKEDYSKLHTKYSDLLKSHMDFVQKSTQSHHPMHVNIIKGGLESNEQKRCSSYVAKNIQTISPPKHEIQKFSFQTKPTSLARDIVEEFVNYSTDLLTEISLADSETASSDFDKNAKDSPREFKVVLENIEPSATKMFDDNKTLQGQETLLPLEFTETSFKEGINSRSGSLKSFLSDNPSQEDLTQDNSTVDALYGECLIASNTSIVKNTMRDLIPSGHLFEIEDDGDAVEESRKSDYTTSNESEYDLMKNVSLYEELSFLDEEVGADFLSVGAEVDKLIQENTELLATKNALNVLKDDLIADVEELSGELELLKEELASVQNERNKQDSRISELEEELKKSREEIAQFQSKLEAKEQADNDGKTFSRIELVRILMERNQYKEKWMELQEAVRWAETVRASKAHPELVNVQNETKKSRTSAVWGFFNSFLGRDKDENLF